MGEAYHRTCCASTAGAGHRPECPTTNCYEWDRLAERGDRPSCERPFGPTKNGSKRCESGSIASGGTNTYCTCDTCF